MRMVFVIEGDMQGENGITNGDVGNLITCCLYSVARAEIVIACCSFGWSLSSLLFLLFGEIMIRFERFE